jgi:hypothetical protein
MPRAAPLAIDDDPKRVPVNDRGRVNSLLAANGLAPASGGSPAPAETLPGPLRR